MTYASDLPLLNLLIYKGSVCLYVLCVCVLYRNPNRWTDLDEIWHGYGPQGGEGSWGVSTLYSHPQVRGA